MRVLRCIPWAPKGFGTAHRGENTAPCCWGGVIGVFTHQLPRGAGDAWLAPSTHFALRTDRGAQHRVPVPPPPQKGCRRGVGRRRGTREGDEAVGSAPHPPYLLGHLCFPAGPANPAETRQDQTPRTPSLGGDVPAPSTPQPLLGGGFPYSQPVPGVPEAPGGRAVPRCPAGRKRMSPPRHKRGHRGGTRGAPSSISRGRPRCQVGPCPTRARNPSHSPFPVFPVVMYWEEEEQRVLVPPQPPPQPLTFTPGMPGVPSLPSMPGRPCKKGTGGSV